MMGGHDEGGVGCDDWQLVCYTVKIQSSNSKKLRVQDIEHAISEK